MTTSLLLKNHTNQSLYSKYLAALNMDLLFILLFLLNLLNLTSADGPECGDKTSCKCYKHGLRWCGQYDSGSYNYNCIPDYDTWCSARWEVLDAIDTLCNGEWASLRFDAWENKQKCWPLHHHTRQHKTWATMHVMFRMKNYDQIPRVLDPETCSESLHPPFPQGS